MKAIRLTGGLDRCAGILEVHRNGSWATVCDNCWNKQLASMVCSMLQCGAEPLKYTQFDPPLKHNNGTLYYYHCDAKAQSLWQCGEYTTPHLCKDSKASGVICNVSTPAPPPPAAAAVISPSPELLSTIALALLLFVFVITSIVLCCLYRRCHGNCGFLQTLRTRLQVLLWTLAVRWRCSLIASDVLQEGLQPVRCSEVIGLRRAPDGRRPG
ncbi:hypothetical protein Q5P01_018627 [Channa striata]|uniref:SRCR domain-containing protein n=1 Tax=Channa striata TaxID=64152 RepID=A0AA88M5K7_CHASR|nr:hypothetical protein Q5P01_018627 [Channa striata]